MNWKIWLLIFFILASLLAIFPLSFSKGVEIISVEENSTSYIQGLRSGMIITNIDSKYIKNIEDYQSAISKFPTTENEKLSINTDKGEFILFTNETPELIVRDIPKTKLKTGLDLSGGARALVRAENKDLTSAELNDLIAVTNERLNVYGLKDLQIKPVKDLSGSNFMLIEIAGSTPSELEDLIAREGKFEAKIGNDTVFSGGKDITYVARTGDQSGIYSCNPDGTGNYICSFRFAISLSEEAAKRHANITCKLGTDATSTQYLDKKLDLFLDEE